MKAPLPLAFEIGLGGERSLVRESSGGSELLRGWSINTYATRHVVHEAARPLVRLYAVWFGATEGLWYEE